MANQQILDLLGDKADFLLNHNCKTIDRSTLHLPSSTLIDDIAITSNRNNGLLPNSQALLNYGGSGYTGYCSISQYIEYCGRSASAPNPIYFIIENNNELAFKGCCNTITSTNQ